MNSNDVDKTIREYLLWLLKSGDAHMTLDDAVADFPMGQINVIFPNSTYSFWGALEHVRRTQADILDFIKNPNYQEREWPEDYWPEKGLLATEADWKKTLSGYRKDLNELMRIVSDPKTNLYEKIPHGTGQTILREILLVADHTAYQIGELATMRRVFGHWDISHP
ncbi:MAG: DinB family protein [Chloroflexota bacterium]|nr:DinB family protein [Chloroflexota bacterium]